MSGTNDNFTLYLHISPSGKKYFGITGQKAKYRWKNGNGYKKNQHFWNAIQKYGWDNIEHIILADDLTKDDACLFEQICIALYDTTNSNKGYNKSLGGEHGRHSEESKQKISEATKGENNPMYGKHHSEETKRKISESQPDFKGKNSPCSKTVICTTTGQVFNGTREAERITGINKSNIASVCRGNRGYAGKSSDGAPLKWTYVQNLPKPKLTEEQKQHLRTVTNNFKRIA